MGLFPKVFILTLNKHHPVVNNRDNTSFFKQMERSNSYRSNNKTPYFLTTFSGVEEQGSFHGSAEKTSDVFEGHQL